MRRVSFLMNKKCTLWSPFFLFLVSAVSTTASAKMPLECGTLANHYGPYNYANLEHRRTKLPVVEHAHFTNKVEQLISGESGTIEGDLDYTLRTFPNHHRALAAFSNQERAQKRVNPEYKTGYFTVNCYFLRAIANAPDDPVVYLLYGIYNDRLKLFDKAEENYLKSIELNSKSSSAHYNLGLLYYRMARYDQSLKHAKIAYSRRFPLPGLMNKLKKSGHWN
jgi:tetratricopeptide (TPR) repeat protein